MRDLESLIYSRITNEFSETIKDKYSMTDSNFSTEGQNNTDATFPFVYIHLMPAIEQGNTLENDTEEGAIYTFQVDVSDNEDTEITKEVMSEVVRIMKSLRFTVSQYPETLFYDGGTNRQISRFRRLIGSDDNL